MAYAVPSLLPKRFRRSWFPIPFLPFRFEHRSDFLTWYYLPPSHHHRIPQPNSLIPQASSRISGTSSCPAFPNDPGRLHVQPAAPRISHNSLSTLETSTSNRAPGAPCMQEQGKRHSPPNQKHFEPKETLHSPHIFPNVRVRQQYQGMLGGYLHDVSPTPYRTAIR